MKLFYRIAVPTGIIIVLLFFWVVDRRSIHDYSKKERVEANGIVEDSRTKYKR